jgi:Zn-dependent protease
MDLFNFMLYAVAGFVVIYFLLYVLTAQNILGVVLKKISGKIIPRSEVPGYLTKFYEIKESQLLNLGFSFQYCALTEDTVIKEYSQRYIFVYYHPQEKTYASLTTSDAADYWMPFQVSFETHFKNGKKLLTYNGLKHAVIGTIPHTIIEDAYAETLEKHFRFHLQHLAGTGAREGEIEEFKPELAEEMVLKQYQQSHAEYLNHLVQKGITYKVGEDKYGIKTLAALKIARQMIPGLNKINALRKKILAQKPGSPGTTDIPVELELTNYQNTRAVLNQPIKNTTGKIIFLLVSLLLFGVAFSVLFSFDFVVLLAAVVLLHESGHLLAMRLFGYKNLKMLFIPLFGAVAMGSDKGVSPYKKVISYFAGPVPGIILGFLLLFKIQQGLGLAPSWHSPTILTAAFMLLGINYFNLLPVLPFDGGQVLNTIIFSRFAFLQIFFYLVSLLAILGLAVVLETPLLFFVALLVGFGAFQAFTQRRIMNTVKQELKTTGPVPGTELLKKIFLVLRQAPYRLYSFRKKFQVVQNLETILNTPKASVVTVMVTLVFYLFLIGAPVVYIFGPLWKMKLGGGLHYPGGYKNPRETVIKYKPGPGSVGKSAKHRGGREIPHREKSGCRLIGVSGDLPSLWP